MQTPADYRIRGGVWAVLISCLNLAQAFYIPGEIGSSPSS